MGYLDSTYTSGVIAAREKYLLKEKIFRLCEVSAEEAFRVLLECNYGGGAERAHSVYEYEKLVEAEEAAVDSFIREYAPSEALVNYLLSPRDFHNAKAFLKAYYLGENAEKMLAPQGLIEMETLERSVKEKDFSSLSAYPLLQSACVEGVALLEEEGSGAKLGVIFEKALYTHLYQTVKRNRILKTLLNKKIDMTNILIALRAGEEENALNKYLPYGNLKNDRLSTLFESDLEKAVQAFKDTEYFEFVKVCLQAKERGLPFTEAEKILASADRAFFAKRKYELHRQEPFLYYVYRRRTENANIRIVFACLLAGLSEQAIKNRLRSE